MSEADTKHSQNQLDKLKKEYDYEKLKESVLPEAEKSDLPVRIQNASLFFKKFSDGAVMGGLGLSALAIVTRSMDMLALTAGVIHVAPFVSAALGGASLIAATARHGNTARDRYGDSAEAFGFRAAFKKAAKGFFVKESFSAACMAATPFLEFMTVVSIFSLGFGGGRGGASALFALSTLVAGLAGGVVGFKANADSEKMEVYERAVIKARKDEAPKPA